MNTTTRVLLAAVLCTAARRLLQEGQGRAAAEPADAGTAAPVTEPGRPRRCTARKTSTPTPACASAWCTSTSTRTPCVRSSRPIVACHAKYLRDRPSSRMTLEGNADERGSREYNLGLGERRGNAVSSALQANGGSGGQITVVSYGEERPTCTDSTRIAGRKNRRVEIVYTAK